MRVTRPGFLLDEDYPAPAPPPELGRDTERWLAELGYGAERIAALTERGVSPRPTVRP